MVIVDELAAPDLLLHYSLHEPRQGIKDIKKMQGVRQLCTWRPRT